MQDTSISGENLVGPPSMYEQEYSPEGLLSPNFFFFFFFFRYLLVAEEIAFKRVQFACPTGSVLNEGGDRCGKGINYGRGARLTSLVPLNPVSAEYLA